MHRQIDIFAVVFLAAAAAGGSVEAVQREESGLAALFALLLIGIVSIGLRLVRRRRHAVGIRGDLHSWLESTSALTGEPVGVLADRCVSAYRAGLTE